MKRTQWISLFQDIKKTFVSFASIAVFVALGIAAFLGIKWNEPAMSQTANRYLDETDYRDFLITFPYGITEDELEAISQIEGVDTVEGAYYASGTTAYGKDRYILAIQGVTYELDKTTALEGTLPTEADEVGIEQQLADALGLEVGDKITIDTGTEGSQYLINTEFTITSIVEHPTYFAKERSYSRGLSNIGSGAVDYYVVVAESAFDMDQYDNSYAQVLVRSNSLALLDTFSDEYDEQAAAISAKIQALGEELAPLRSDTVFENTENLIEQVEDRIRDEETRLEEAKQQVADGKQEISDAEAEIAEGEAQIAAAEEELENARAELTAGKAEVQEGQSRISQAENEIAENESTLAAAQAEYEAGLAEYNENYGAYSTGLAELESTLSANGFSADLETAKTEAASRIAALEQIRTHLNVAIVIMNSAAEILREYNEYGGDASLVATIEKKAEILYEIMRAAGLDVSGEYVAEHFDELYGQWSSLKEEYAGWLADYSELSAVYAALNSFGINTDNLPDASVLSATASLALNLIDGYLNPDIPVEEKIADAMVLTEAFKAALPDYDISDVPAFLEERAAALNSLAGNIIDGSLSSLNELTGAIDRAVSAETQLAEAKARLDSAAGQLAEGRAVLESGKQQLADSKAQLEAYIQEINEGEAEIAAGEAELSARKAELAEGKTQLETGRQEISDSEEQIADGEDELTQAKTDIEEVKEIFSEYVHYDKWTIQDRGDVPCLYAVESYAASNRSLCYTLALLFVFVGLMVCYTSITRNVNEARKLIGMQKSLGLRVGEITMHYMAYSLIAAFAGAVLGCLLGYFVIESIMNHAYTRLYLLGDMPNVFVWREALLISAVEIFLIAAVTWLTCRKVLRGSAISLLGGHDYGHGRTRFYEKTGFWKRLSLYTQTTVNNLFNDRARVIATLVGVTGCTALVIMSLSLRMSILNTTATQFSKLWFYDASIAVDDSIEGAEDSVRSVLDEEAVDYGAIMRKSGFIVDEEGSLNKTEIIVPETADSLEGFIALNDWYGDEELELTDNGVIISRTYEKHHSVKVGDTIQIMDTNGVYHDYVIAGVSEFYLSALQVVMSREYYEQVMGEEAVNNTFLILYGDHDVSKLQEKIKNAEGYFSITDDEAKWEQIFGASSGVTMLLLWIALILSASMALLVLLNLNVVCINEKKNELIVMRINGFSIGKTKQYIYRDNIILTLLGIIAGSFAGYWLGIWILNILERNYDNYFREPDLRAFIIGLAITGAFALFTNVVSLRRINKLRISDLNRM